MVSGTIYDIYIWTPIENRKAIDNLCENNNKDLKIFKARNIQEDSELLNRDNNLNESAHFFLFVRFESFFFFSIILTP